MIKSFDLRGCERSGEEGGGSRILITRAFIMLFIYNSIQYNMIGIVILYSNDYNIILFGFGFGILSCMYIVGTVPSRLGFLRNIIIIILGRYILYSIRPRENQLFPIVTQSVRARLVIIYPR